MTLLVRSVISFAGSVLVRTLIYSGVMLCLWFTELLAKEGRVPLIYDVMVCMALCCVMMCDGDTEIWTFWCYAVLWRHRRAGDHIFCALCMTYISKVNILIFWACTYFLYFYFVYASDWFSVSSALHTQYIFRTDPLSSGGCVSCPQVQTHSLVIHQLRTSPSAVWSALLISEHTFWYTFVRYV